ncbi:uncharacterized protein LOC132601516 [Lycium barbarum]|uniref:uncharacterized protein LOC132601516 n=1 Tax=Lycium barbarum TaxID=112863 RepID=UPI00293ED237|nr:uncharacterized protein LOC132601516 [Lycium barbarum]
MYQLANTITEAWMIGGDFNVPQDVEDFAFCVNSCELEEISFKGSPFTWWNGRARDDCIFERLDRMLINAPLQNWFSSLEVEQLARTGSDHTPLLCTYGEIDKNQYKPLKFLKFWVERDFFIDTVKHNWPGDIFKQIIIRKEIVRIKEELFEEDPSHVNRCVLQNAETEIKKYLQYQEDYWRKKSGLDWLVEGDRNTKFFHTIVKGRRKKLQIRKIQNSEGDWIEEEDQIAAEAISFYEIIVHSGEF